MGGEWRVYFGTTAAIAATLLGLAFVAFQLSRQWSEDELLRLVATLTLTEFLVPVVVGIAVLMPGNRWRYAAGVAGLSGLSVVTIHLHRLIISLRQEPDRPSTRVPDRFDKTQGLLDAISILTYSAIFVSAFLSPTTSASLLAPVLLWLIVSGSTEAFTFMGRRDETATRRGSDSLHVRRAVMTRADAPAGRSEDGGRSAKPDGPLGD